MSSNMVQSLFKPFPRNQLATKRNNLFHENPLTPRFHMKSRVQFKFPTPYPGRQSFAARGFGLQPKMCRPSAKTENFRRTWEKPLSSGTQGTHPLEDSDNQIPSSPGRQRSQMPGVCPGGDVEASIWPIHYLLRCSRLLFWLADIS